MLNLPSSTSSCGYCVGVSGTLYLRPGSPWRGSYFLYRVFDRVGTSSLDFVERGPSFLSLSRFFPCIWCSGGVVCYYFLLYDFLVANLSVDSCCFTGCNQLHGLCQQGSQFTVLWQVLGLYLLFRERVLLISQTVLAGVIIYTHLGALSAAWHCPGSLQSFKEQLVGLRNWLSAGHAPLSGYLVCRCLVV